MLMRIFYSRRSSGRNSRKLWYRIYN